MNVVPAPLADWMASLPSQNVGTLYAKIRPPYFPLARWHKVDGWGQLCDGRDHRRMVHLMLYNKFPFRGKGWTYIEWRSEPDNPQQCKYPTRGKVADPKPYSGIAYE